MSRKIQQPKPEDQILLLSISDVCRKTKIGETKLRDMIHNGKFPRYRKIGGRCRFLSTEVDAWIKSHFE